MQSTIQSRDPNMDSVLQKIFAASRVSSNVVITGESGTGKELVARTLHQGGPRRNGPFVPLNCAAIPDSLLESELFGYVRGAFTDARENKPGLFVRANGGTLFLDEIGDASLMIQTKLLRVLQEREVLPLGATSPVKLDLRVIAATHRSLLEEMDQGCFRRDLFYRLQVIPIHIPPLRERPLDILFLARLFAQRLAKELRISFKGITSEAEVYLEKYRWPGNIRELQNRVEHALVLTQEGWITTDGLFPEGIAFKSPVFISILPQSSNNALELKTENPRNNVLSTPSFGEAKKLFERTYLERILVEAHGNISKAARIAMKSRTEIYALLRKHGLNPLGFKSSSKPVHSS